MIVYKENLKVYTHTHTHLSELVNEFNKAEGYKIL